MATLSATLSAWVLCQAERGRNCEKKKGNKGRCLFEWLHSVSTAHGGKARSMSLLGLFNLLLLLFGGTTGDAHSSSNYYHLFRGIVLGRVPTLLSRCSRVSQRTHLGAPVPSRETSSITELARRRSPTIGESASTEVVVLTETPCLSDRGQWVTYSPPTFYWRPAGKRLISHAGLKVMWFEMQYHINQSLNVTVPIPAAFTQAGEGKLL